MSCREELVDVGDIFDRMNSVSRLVIVRPLCCSDTREFPESFQMTMGAHLSCAKIRWPGVVVEVCANECAVSNSMPGVRPCIYHVP